MRHQTLLPRAIEISVQVRHGVYDCLYVALAEREACNLLTADTKVLFNLTRDVSVHYRSGVAAVIFGEHRTRECSFGGLKRRLLHKALGV